MNDKFYTTVYTKSCSSHTTEDYRSMEILIDTRILMRVFFPSLYHI